MKRLLILGGPIFQIPVVQKAKEMNLYTGVVDINKDAPAMRYADQTFVGSIRDKELMLKYAKEFQPDGIMIGACDTSVCTGAYLCKVLGLPGNTEETALKATDKVEMLNAFRMEGVAHPAFQVVMKEEVDSVSTEIPFPVISKPTDSAGGRGINLIESENELLTKVKISSRAGVSGNVLIEEYMEGAEVSVEVLVIEGTPYVLQITDKFTSGSPYFYEIGHVQPSMLPGEIKKQVCDLACKAVLAVGLYNSAAHVEIKITKEGPKMVELGGRLGGDWITSHLIDYSVSGICMTEAAIQLALGIQPNISSYRLSNTACAVLFIPAKKGIIQSVAGIENAKGIGGVVKAEITAKTGKRYDNATDDTSRFGYVVAIGENPTEALHRCQTAIKQIKIQFLSEE